MPDSETWGVLELPAGQWWLGVDHPLRMRVMQVEPLYRPDGTAGWVKLHGHRELSCGMEECAWVLVPATALPDWARPLVPLRRSDVPRIADA